MKELRATPGVYINELNAFPNSIVEVATSLPVFIGYTQKADFQGTSLQNQVVRITCLQEYNSFFGYGPNTMFNLTKIVPSDSTQSIDVTLNNIPYNITPQKGGMFYMYNSLQLFFQNGGSDCFIMSIGTYEKEGANGPNLANFQTLSEEALGDVFSILKNQQDPTLILIPDALLFTSSSDYYTLMNDCIDHCGDVQSRITLIDAYGGNLVTDPITFAKMQTTFDANGNSLDPIGQLRGGITSPFLNYSAAYYPWVDTNIVSSDQFNFSNIIGGFTDSMVDSNDPTLVNKVANIIAQVPTVTSPSLAGLTEVQKEERIAAAQLTAHNALLSISANYNLLMQAILAKVNCLPVTPAIAGCIATVDGSQGVWKSPANIALNAVQSVVLTIDDNLQSTMNVDAATGKSVNAIRLFNGMGILVWGARTLDGNSQDWRYISVRRTLIMIEQSVKLAASTYVFQPNDANTWFSLKSEIENFLTGLWKQGALAGAKPEDAFSVSVGLGSTMNAEDILDGYMNVMILVAVTHPAEFIEIVFKQQMQAS